MSQLLLLLWVASTSRQDLSNQLKELYSMSLPFVNSFHKSLTRLMLCRIQINLHYKNLIFLVNPIILLSICVNEPLDIVIHFCIYGDCLVGIFIETPDENLCIHRISELVAQTGIFEVCPAASTEAFFPLYPRHVLLLLVPVCHY